MNAVDVVKESLSKKTIQLKEEVSKYVDSVFKMYGGPLYSVVLEFERELLGVVYDKFGEDTTIMKIGNDTLLTSVNVQLSPTFWGWIFQFGNKMKIISPTEVIEEYKKKIEEIRGE